jgi:hypothetical protein
MGPAPEPAPVPASASDVTTTSFVLAELLRFADSVRSADGAGRGRVVRLGEVRVGTAPAGVAAQSGAEGEAEAGKEQR